MFVSNLRGISCTLMIIFSPKHLIFRLCCLSRHLKVVLACRKITSVLDNSNGSTKRGHLKHKTTFLKGNYLLSEEVIFWVFVCGFSACYLWEFFLYFIFHCSGFCALFPHLLANISIFLVLLFNNF